MQRHFLRDESVQVDVLEAVAPAAAGRYGAGGAAAAAASSGAAAPAHVCGRPGSAGAHADARHGPTQTCGKDERTDEEQGSVLGSNPSI